MEFLQATRPEVARAVTPVVQPVHIDRLEQTVNLLLSPAERESEAWRQDVVGAMRALMDADRAVMLLGQSPTPSLYSDAVSRGVIAEYLSDFAPLDHGMA